MEKEVRWTLVRHSSWFFCSSPSPMALQEFRIDKKPVQELNGLVATKLQLQPGLILSSVMLLSFRGKPCQKLTQSPMKCSHRTKDSAACTAAPAARFTLRWVRM